MAKNDKSQNREKEIARPSLFDYLPSNFEFPAVSNFLGSWPQTLRNIPSFSDVTMYEDKKGHLVVEAPLPGLTADETEVTVNRGRLWIKGHKEESQEDKENKYYRRSNSSFSYYVNLPSNIDETIEPKATFKDGVLKIAFTQTKQKQGRKIPVKNG